MDFTQIDGKLFGGDNGEGVLIEQLAFKFDTDMTTKDDTVLIEIMGTAKTVMKDPWNPLAGYEEVEPFPVKDTIKLIVAQGKNADNQILINSLNRQFKLNPPLVDNHELWERFTKDGEDSVYDSLVGQRAYFKARKSNTKTGEQLSHYFFNLVRTAERLEPEMDAVKDKIAELIAKRKQKEKEKEDADKALLEA